MRPVLRGVLVVTAVVAAAGAASSTATSSPAARCLSPAPPLVKTLKSGLRPSAHARLVRVAAVRGQGAFSGVLKGGAYFVSANVGSKRMATWAVSTAAYRSGHGAILAVDGTARKVSRFGTLLSPELVASWGASPRSAGYRASRTCAQK